MKSTNISKAFLKSKKIHRKLFSSRKGNSLRLVSRHYVACVPHDKDAKVVRRSDVPCSLPVHDVYLQKERSDPLV